MYVHVVVLGFAGGEVGREEAKNHGTLRRTGGPLRRFSETYRRGCTGAFPPAYELDPDDDFKTV